MAHHSGSRRPPTPTTINGLSFQDSPCVMRFQVSHVVGPFGVPHRTTPPGHTAPNKQLPAVVLRLSPSLRLTNARIRPSKAPRTRPAQGEALPTSTPRAQRTDSLTRSKAKHTSGPQAASGRTHTRHAPTTTAQAATQSLPTQTPRFGARRSPTPRDSPSRQIETRKRETVTESCTLPATASGGKPVPPTSPNPGKQPPHK